MWTLTLVLACSGGDEDDPRDPVLPTVDLPEGAPQACAHGVEVIVDTPETETAYMREGLTRYTEVVAPNGHAIAVFAADELSDAQILRARNLLRFYLQDLPDSQHGEDKTAVANAMADNGAALALPNGAHSRANEPRVNAQPLYDAETPVAGSDWFMDNDYEHRDAAFEEIFHLVHDTGIGTYLPGALPEYQAELLAEAQAAIADGRWGIAVDPEVEDWLDELEREGSLAQEYIASVIDSYYGLWGPWTEADGGMWGVYIAKTRDEVATLDPAGLELLQAFLAPTLTIEEPVDPDFTGTLSLVFDEAEPYTHKTRYFQAVRLTGSGDAGIAGNDLDNTFVPNAGDNVLSGGAGDDTVVYCGERADYTVAETDGTVTVSGGDAGQDTLTKIEILHFLDGAVAVTEL
jgi:hypothetical protein